MISTTPKKPMENNSITINVDVHRQDEHRTHDNDIIDHQTKVQTPRKRAYFEKNIKEKKRLRYQHHIQNIIFVLRK
jgi:hypothetical protein